MFKTPAYEYYLKPQEWNINVSHVSKCIAQRSSEKANGYIKVCVHMCIVFIVL